MPRYAAVDIGSNSVRMLAAEVPPGGEMTVLAAAREVTRLGASVFRGGAISREAMEFTCGVLKTMAGAYQKLEIAGIRVVATAAVRDASNQQEFLERASVAAAASVEIISGHEEARLIHLGVQTRWPHPNQKLMIVDVGGGSAEIIVADSGRISEVFSKPLGAVRLTGMFLRNDPPGALQLEQMHEFIEEKLAPVTRRLGLVPDARAIATSSTSAAMVCAVNRIPRARRDEADRLRATLPQVRKLYRELCALDAAKRAKIPGIGPRRAEIVVAGVGVLLECMQRFQLPAFHYSTAGVREGIIADLAARRVGRGLAQLTREQRQVAQSVAAKFGVALKHARHVASTCHTLFEALNPLHRLRPDFGKLLEAAAILYDSGQAISDTGHHKHSQYIVVNSDLPGFTDRERILISLLCRFHRKSMPGPRHAEFQALPVEDRRALVLLIPILRLADSFDLGKEQRVESVTCEIESDAVTVRIAGEEKIELEQWAGQRVGEVFQEIYGRPLVVLRGKT